MAKTVFNLVNGEKYGDANDPKTRWTNHGIFSLNDDKADPADIEAFKRLVDARAVSLRIESIPTSKHFDGWLSVFERREYQPNGQQGNAASDVTLPDATDDKPIDLSEIPF